MYTCPPLLLFIIPSLSFLPPSLYIHPAFTPLLFIYRSKSKVTLERESGKYNGRNRNPTSLLFIDMHTHIYLRCNAHTNGLAVANSGTQPSTISSSAPFRTYPAAIDLTLPFSLSVSFSLSLCSFLAFSLSDHIRLLIQHTTTSLPSYCSHSFVKPLIPKLATLFSLTRASFTLIRTHQPPDDIHKLITPLLYSLNSHDYFSIVYDPTRSRLVPE